MAETTSLKRTPSDSWRIPNTTEAALKRLPALHEQRDRRDNFSHGHQAALVALRPARLQPPQTPRRPARAQPRQTRTLPRPGRPTK
eukprot:7405940-Lingulodinium_polyedra.AAC.1